MNKTWRKLLQENWFKEADEGRAEFLNFTDLDKLFNAFHVSSELLDNKEFTFTPRVPKGPYNDINGMHIEDDFTPRVSIGPTVGMCLKALEGSSGFLYAADFKLIRTDDVELHNLGQKFFPKCVKTLSGPNNTYGPGGFNLLKFAEPIIGKKYPDHSEGGEAYNRRKNWLSSWDAVKEKYMKGCVLVKQRNAGQQSQSPCSILVRLWNITTTEMARSSSPPPLIVSSNMWGKSILLNMVNS
jgi:hypothetical protein